MFHVQEAAAIYDDLLPTVSTEDNAEGLELQHDLNVLLRPIHSANRLLPDGPLDVLVHLWLGDERPLCCLVVAFEEPAYLVHAHADHAVLLHAHIKAKVDGGV